MAMACAKSPAFRYSFAKGAKYRRGFSSNFFRRSSIRAEVAMAGPKGEPPADGGG